MLSRIFEFLQLLILVPLAAAVLTYSAPPQGEPADRVRAFTRAIEFDYVRWTLEATWLKAQAASIALPHGLSEPEQLRVVREYLASTQQVLELEHRLEEEYANPSGAEGTLGTIRSQLGTATARLERLSPMAEAVLEEQVTQVVVELGLAWAGQPIPGVLFHTTPLPMALIASPRDQIEQAANISVDAELGMDKQIVLETNVERSLGLSALVVPVGGVGVYPTMVTRSTDVRWLVETIAHEWIHNHLTMRPLGVLYDASPSIRTMNETTAAIAGAEIASNVMRRFYPEAAPNAGTGPAATETEVVRPNPGDLPRPPFDFRREMHATRVHVDRLLAAGSIDEAEAYMERQRQVFLRNGFVIRRLNQAYFAFYGAYAETPEGPAGADPVGAAVRRLRAQSASLADFVNRISWMTSAEQLERAVRIHG